MIYDIRKTVVDFGCEKGVTRLDYTSEYDGQSDWALLGGNMSSTMWIVFIHGDVVTWSTNTDGGGPKC